jgi:glycosyltransferase involved in cell wall biosynthesis
VLAQSYPRWELLVADDHSVDATAEMVASFADARITLCAADGRGACAARNVALDRCKGDLIAYLDDDNTLHPEWLKSVVWAFEQRPDIDVVYGALVIDDTLRVNKEGRGDLPRLFFNDYDHASLPNQNVTDISAMAHRNGLPEGRFDESLREMGDWDLLLRLTHGHPPLALPVIACFYHTDAPNRLSFGDSYDADAAAVRARNRR